MYDGIMGSDIQFISVHLLFFGQFLLAELHSSISEKANGLSWLDHTPLHGRVIKFRNIPVV